MFLFYHPLTLSPSPLVWLGVARVVQLLESGKCGCLDYDLTQGDDYKSIMNSMVFVSGYIGDFSEDVQRSVVATLCNGIANDGDHLQVNS